MAKINLHYGDCIELLQLLEPNSIDLIFADPPYNLSGKNNLTVKSGKIAACDKGDWDIIENIHTFNERWIKECVKVLSEKGTLWISGTLHNYPSIGVILKKLNLWIINDVIWFKRNAPPLFSQNRFVPSTEIIWVASKSKKYYFNYAIAKKMNGGKQMRNLWEINAERHKTKHPTEKPESLLERILLIGSKENNTVLDPFMGSGTTGAVAKRLERNFVGYEINKEYFEIAKARIGIEQQFKILTDYLEKSENESCQLNMVYDKKAKYKIRKK